MFAESCLCDERMTIRKLFDLLAMGGEWLFDEEEERLERFLTIHGTMMQVYVVVDDERPDLNVLVETIERVSKKVADFSEELSEYTAKKQEEGHHCETGCVWRGEDYKLRTGATVSYDANPENLIPPINLAVHNLASLLSQCVAIDKGTVMSEVPTSIEDVFELFLGSTINPA